MGNREERDGVAINCEEIGNRVEAIGSQNSVGFRPIETNNRITTDRLSRIEHQFEYHESEGVPNMRRAIAEKLRT